MKYSSVILWCGHVIGFTDVVYKPSNTCPHIILTESYGWEYNLPVIFKCGLQESKIRFLVELRLWQITRSVVFSAKYLEIVAQACQMNMANKIAVKIMLT